MCNEVGIYSNAIDKTIMDILINDFKIEKIYYVNLDRRLDRNVRFLTELNKHSIVAERISGVDALYSNKSAILWKNYIKNDIYKDNIYISHLNKDVLISHKKNSSAATFAYSLSQLQIISDAKQKGYKKILIFDDDIFFHSQAGTRLHNIYKTLPKNYKILLLGASEYSSRNSLEFICSKISTYEFYHPIPGQTCGSFAVIYDESIYEEIIQTIQLAKGTFDNVVLGYLYKKYRKFCYAIDPSICIPNVDESDVRGICRNQVAHGKKMNWENVRYDEYMKEINISVIVNDFVSLKNIETMTDVLGKNIFLHIFYRSVDGIRPVIVGHTFSPKDTHCLPIEYLDPIRFGIYTYKSRLPYSDIILSWPAQKILSEESVMTIFSLALQQKNKFGIKSGKINNTIYCMNAGIRPISGRHSIIIPTYRGSAAAWASIKSALSQNKKNFEVIIVNDNPEYVNFIKELQWLVQQWNLENNINFSTKNLIVINHKINRNAAASRNTGIMRSSGEVISFLDDDDLYFPNRIKSIEKFFTSASKKYGAVYCGYIKGKDKIINMDRFIAGNLKKNVLLLDYRSHYMNSDTISFLRSSLIRLGGFNECYFRHQDIELLLRFFENFEINYCPEILVKIRPSSAETTFVPEFKKMIKLKCLLLSDMKHILSNYDQEFIEKVINSHVDDIIKEDKSKSIAKKEILKFVLHEQIQQTI